MKYDLQPEGPRLSGTINGRSVELAATQQGSDTEAAIAVVHVSVELHDAPPEMTAEGIPGFVGHLAALGQERIELGAPEFDRDVLIRGADESLVRAYWTESRRSAFLDLVRSETGDQVMLRNGRLESELREIVSELETLDGILNSLLRTAEQMDLAD
ncbi:MAG: hypothetical protein DWQ34_21930 [Planctomycetota bacterium]|nr:MAG: hypothetical protein DWQ29_15045 [Planctomycetota bacterium]REJ88486.1 MAG: hypothetical protein DWQ34_21930 [Planctomycetota bacterium]REK22457.1 MAG: hypothetical protein DWQ41_19315 [Planctomycetota bacterium]REK34893.1 MAG: hypothetical protein DWQ45_12350 [Planctomycetota bacterium]